MAEERVQVYEFFTKSIMQTVAKVIKSNFPRDYVLIIPSSASIETTVPPKEMARIMSFPYESRYVDLED